MAKLSTYKFINPGSSGKTTPAIRAVRKGILAKNRIGSTISGLSLVVADMRDIAWANVKLDVIESKLLRRKAQRQADQDAEDKTENNKIVGRKLTTKRKPTTKEKKKFGDIFGWMGNVWGPIARFIVSLLKFYVVKDLLAWVGDPTNREKLKEFVRKSVFVIKKLYNFGKWLIMDNILTPMSELLGGEDEDGNKVGFLGQVKNLGKVLFGFISLRWLLNPFALIGDILGLLDFIMNWEVPRFNNRGRLRKPPKKPRKPRRLPWWQKNTKSLDRMNKSYKRFIQGTSNFGDRLRLIRRGQIGLQGLFNKGGFKDGKLKGQKWKLKNPFKDLRLGEKFSNVTGIVRKNATKVGNNVQNWFKGLELGKKGTSVLDGLKSLPGKIGGKIREIDGGRTKKALDATKEFLANIGPAAKKNFKKYRNLAGNIAGGVGRFTSKWAKRAWNLPGNIEKGIQNRILKPIWEFVQPYVDTFLKKGQEILGAINKIPIINKITKALQKRGITWGAIGKKGAQWGKRAGAAIPLIGGLVNYYFAGQSFKYGDNIAGVLETIAGTLDMAGGISTLTGVGATWGVPMMVAGTTIDAYLLARIIPGVGEAIMQWEQDGGLLKLIPGLVEATNMIANKFGGQEAQDKLKEASNIMAGKGDKTIESDLSTITFDGKTYPKGLSGPMETFGGKGGSTYKDEDTKQKKKPWWKFWGGKKKTENARKKNFEKDLNKNLGVTKKKENKQGKKAWWDFMGVFTGKKSSDSEPGKLPQAWGFLKKVWNVVKSPFEWAYNTVVKPVVDFAGNIIGDLGEIASNVLNSELGQILSVALPIIFPQYAWIEKVITGMRAFSALSQGNPMAAVMSLWNTGANIFPETFAKWETGIGNFFSNNFGKPFGKLWSKGQEMYEGFMDSKIGKISSALIQGNYGAALGAAVDGTKFGDQLSAFGSSVENMGLGGILNSIPGVGSAIQNIPGIASMPGMGALITGDFSPSSFISGMADKAGMGGVYRAMMGMAESGDLGTGLRELAPELGVDKRVLGVVDNANEIFRDGKFDSEYALQTAIEMVAIPIIMEKIEAVPVPVDTSSGVGEQLSSMSGVKGLLNRMGGAGW